MGLYVKSQTAMFTKYSQVPLDATFGCRYYIGANCYSQVRLTHGQGLSVIRDCRRLSLWIPAFAGMTNRDEGLRFAIIERPWTHGRHDEWSGENEVKDRPCPAVKRNGEACESTFVSASGYCFAHDPEAAEWRAKGGRESSKKRRTMKKLKDMGVKHVFDALDEALEGLRSGEMPAQEAIAIARVADTMMKVVGVRE